MGWMREHRLPVALAAAYGVALVVLVAGPWGWALNRLTVWCYVQLRYRWPVAPDWALPEHYGVLLNVVLFVPAGALLVLLVRWPWWWATGLAVLGSAAIEVAQGLFLARDASWADVVANTLGALVGAVAVSLLGSGRRARRRAG